MAVKCVTQFPLFSPPLLQPQPHRPSTEIRLSRWNNANAEKFIRHERNQKELEDQLRFQKRFDSALSIAHNYNPAHPQPTIFKSTGTPSSPSSPSIPGKASKYSKSPPHPAFQTLSKPRKFPIKPNEPQTSDRPNFRIDENGVSYEMPEAPFLYQYSYTETPKVKPVKLREPLVSPFGPQSMAKPWMGRKPLPPSKKKLPEFDSFKLPPPNKKGVKPVQAPGPFLQGSGPKYVRSREEIIGEPLTTEEIDLLIQGAKKSERQLNIGRDGLTHNMLDNIHAHFKRRRVCKIKCKGVCTVDMNNVCEQLEALQQQLTSLFNLFEANNEEQDRCQQDLNQRLDELAAFQTSMSHSNSKENNGSSRSHSHEPRTANNNGGTHPFVPKYSKIDFPRFDGLSDPLNWISRCEHFFRHQHTSKDERVGLASFHLEGDAQLWFLKLERDRPNLTWEVFKEYCHLRFGPPIRSNKLESYPNYARRVRWKNTNNDLNNYLPGLLLSTVHKR